MVVKGGNNMADKRMIDCNFLNEYGFQRLPNKAKLLYYQMITRADNKGFIGSTSEIIENLSKKDETECIKEETTNDYIKALVELISNGFLYEFKDNYGNAIHLIRHWFVHNKFIKGLSTNYAKFLYRVELIDGVYHLKEEETHLKENKTKQNKTKQNKDISNNNLLNNEELEFNDIINDIDNYGKGSEEDEPNE